MVKIDALAYVVVQSSEPAQWRPFAEAVLGMAVTDGPDGGLRLKMDERAFRIAIVPGADDRYLVSGWSVADPAAFEAALAALANAGVATHKGSAEECEARCVTALAGFDDPSGNRHELSCGYTGGMAPFTSKIGVEGFVTGRYGVGHTVLPSLNFDASLAFFRDVLGFGLSDIFNFQPGPDAPVMRIYFLHGAAGRHHSLALAEMPSPVGCVHLMVEVTDKAEVERAEMRREALGVKLMATLGQHENDRMTSFYLLTPGGFALEYGWGGMIIDPATHQTTQTERVSIWGHDFSVGFA